jgi:release factor glutamine methyltransferase
MLPTPETSHVPFNRVYEPAEDSYLLLDTLSSESEKTFLQDRFRASSSEGGNWANSPLVAPVVVEIGTGSGVVLAFVNAHAKIIFGHSSILTIGVDVNTHACAGTEETVKIAAQDQLKLNKSPGNYLGSIVGDLTTPLRPNSVDVLIFNPPYVPTPDLPALPLAGETLGKTTFEEDSYLLSLSYAGGADGMETTERLLALLPSTLSIRGVAYILFSAQNKPEDVKTRIGAWGTGWKVDIVGSSGKKAGWERLQIMRVSRSLFTIEAPTKIT